MANLKQFAIIGLGNFGKYLSLKLYELGHDVLAIDRIEKKVQEVKNGVTRAVILDATNKEALEGTGIKEVDAVIVTIGSSIGDSILVTMSLMDMGIKEVYAKAVSETHGKVLERLGVKKVFFPEKDMAFLWAERLHNPNILEYLPYLEGYGIFEFPITKEFVSKSLKDLDLINRFGLQVLAVKKKGLKDIHIVPKATHRFQEGDVVVVLGPEKGLQRLLKE